MNGARVSLGTGIFIAARSTRDRHQREAVSCMLDRMRGARLTYVDALSPVSLNRYDIGIVWATDRNLGITGAEVLARF